MAKPISERGIRWQETYGEKSSYLKAEMDKQVGKGSYFRWEGHDYTTGTDYYVVVSPGFSKRKGYFFFAGLRKMPADHGASGKHFSTQAEALSYAFDTWNVPRPADKPAKAYTRDDIRDKPIVLEAQHKRASSIGGLTIISGIRHDAMAMRTTMEHGGLGSSWKRLGTAKQVASMLCGALRDSGTKGFLAAYYSRLGVAGIDGTNHKTKSPHPYAPLVAKPQPVTQAELDKFSSSTVRKRLHSYKPKKSGKYEVTEPRRKSSAADGSYVQKTWNDFKLYVSVNAPYWAYGRTEPLWKELEQLGKGLPPGKYDNQRQWDGGEAVSVLRAGGMDPAAYLSSQKRRSKASEIPVVVGVVPSLYPKVKQAIAGFSVMLSGGPIRPLRVPTGNQWVLNKNEKTMANIVEEMGAAFDPSQVIAEESRLSGSQMLVYDEHGMPFCAHSPRSKGSGEMTFVPRSAEDAPADTHDMLGQLRNSLNGSKRLVADHVRFGLVGEGSLSAKYEELLAEQYRGADPTSRARAQALADRIRRQTEHLLKSGVGKDTETAKFLALCDKYVEARLAAAKKSYDLMAAGTRIGPHDEAVAAMNEALAAVRPYFVAFKAMASTGLPRLNSGRFVHGATCAPVMAPVYIASYDLDEAGLPRGGSAGLKKQVLRELLPKAKVGARKEGEEFKARSMSFEDGVLKEGYDALPPGAKPEQEISGAELRIPGGRQFALLVSPDEPSPSYEMSPSDEKGLTRMDPNSAGRMVSGGAFSVVARPRGESPQKTGKGLTITPGWEADYVEHVATEGGSDVPGVPRVGDQIEPKALFDLHPDKHKEFYEVEDENGNVVDLSKYAAFKDNGVLFENSGALMLALKRKLGLSDQVIGAFTREDSGDLFLAKSKAASALRVYSLVKKFREGALTDAYQIKEAGGIERALRSPTDPASRELKDLYDFGEVCSLCGTRGEEGMGESFDPEVGTDEMKARKSKFLEVIDGAMKNPRESMRPKRGKMWGIRLTSFDKQGKGTREWLKNKSEDERPLLFDAHDPLLKQYKSEALRLNPASDPKETPYTETDLLVPSVTGTRNLVAGRENVERIIHKDRGEQPPPEPWGDDAPEPKAEEKAPEAAAPEAAPLHAPPPVPEPQAPAAPTQPPALGLSVMTMLRAISGMAERNKVDPNNLASAPPQAVAKIKEMIGKLQGSVMPEAQAALDKELAAKGLDKVLAWNAVTPVAATPAPATAKVLEGLVRLADKLDSEGRKAEAEAVDRVIRKAGGRTR
jgi:hypothetical protein